MRPMRSNMNTSRMSNFFCLARFLMICSLSRFSARTLWLETPSSCSSWTMVQPILSQKVRQAFRCMGMSAWFLSLWSTCLSVETRYNVLTRFFMVFLPFICCTVKRKMHQYESYAVFKVHSDDHRLDCIAVLGLLQGCRQRQSRMCCSQRMPSESASADG